MEVIIYDGPPSIGTTLWVEDKIGSYASNDTMIVPHFIKLRTLKDVTLPDKILLARVRDRFLKILEEARTQKKSKVIFDGSPATLVALEHLNTGVVSTKSRKAITRYLANTEEKVSVVLLMPETRFNGPNNMRSFDANQVVPFGQSLEIAYNLAGFEPTIVDIARSPYTPVH